VNANLPPAFSVVVPTYRRENLLWRAIESVLRQTWKDFELIVVDDASPDHGAERAVTRFADPRLRMVRREVNGGAAATRNTGIREARGALVALLDDDDEYLPRFLERTYETLAHAPQEVGFTWCGVRWVEPRAGGTESTRDEVWTPTYPSREEAYLGFLRSRRIGTNCGLAFRRDALREVGGFDEAFPGGAEDTDLLVRLVRRFDFRVVPETLIRIHLHGGDRLRGVTVWQAEGYERILAKHRTTLAAHPDVAAELHYKTGWLHYHAGNRRKGRRHLLTSLARRAFRPRTWAALVLHEIFGARAPSLHRRLSTLRRRTPPLSVVPDRAGEDP